MQIKKLCEVIKPEKAKIVVYGPSGSGKTTLIGTLPGSVLILSAEAGLMSLDAVKGRDDIDVLEIKDMKDFADSYVYAKQNLAKYDFVVLDSVSEIAEQILTAEKAKTKDPRQAYGALIDESDRMLKAFRNLDIGVVLICKEEKTKDEKTGVTTSSIMIPGSKVSQKIPYLFDVVMRLAIIEDPQTRTKRRLLQTETSSTAECKDRSGKLDTWEDPDLDVVIRKMCGETIEAEA